MVKLLLALAFIVEGEREPAVQRGTLLVRVPLHFGIDVVWQVEVLFEQPQYGIEKLPQVIFLISIRQVRNCGRSFLLFKFLVDSFCLRGIRVGLLVDAREGCQFSNRPLSNAALPMRFADL